MENDDEGMVNICTCELEVCLLIRVNVSGKNKKLSFYMCFYGRKQSFQARKKNFLVFPAFLRRKLIKSQTLTRRWSSAQYAHTHIFLMGNIVDLMAQELFKKNSAVCLLLIFIPNRKDFPDSSS